MARNGSGTYVSTTGNPVVTGTVIQSTTFNTTITDIGNELTNSLPRDGQAPMTAPLKITDGSVSVPGLAFNSESSTGFGRPSAGQIALSVLGVERLRFDSSGVAGNLVLNNSVYLSSKTSGGTTTRVLGINAINDIYVGSIDTATGGSMLFLNGSERMRIDASGNIAIGNNTNYQIKNTGGTAQTVLNLGSDNNVYMGQVTAPGGASTFLYGNQIIFCNASERMRIDASGNLGIGAAPTSKLHIGGSGSQFFEGPGADTVPSLTTALVGGEIISASSAGADRGFLRLSAGGRSTLSAKTAIDIQGFGATDNCQIRFATAGVERMRLDSSGNVLIGTTGTGPLNSNSASLSPTSSGGIDLNHLSGTASGVLYARFNYNATTIGSITQSGTTAVLYNTSSDARLKTNIVDMADQGSVIDALRPREYEFKTEPGKKVLGFVAQELFEVAPQAVSAGDDGEHIEKTWGVDYSKLVPMLVKEVQSLRARLSVLEAA